MSAGDSGLPSGNNRLKRRDFLKVISAVPFLRAPKLDSPRGTLVNDVHTGWNPTWVDRVERPSTAVELQSLIKAAKKQGKIISVSGSRHATGGQQFAARSVLVDMRGMTELLQLLPDPEGPIPVTDSVADENIRHENVPPQRARKTLAL